MAIVVLVERDTKEAREGMELDPPRSHTGTPMRFG